MAVVIDRSPKTLSEACLEGTKKIARITSVPYENLCLQFELISFDEESVITSVHNSARMMFKSRDRNMLMVGLGCADRLTTSDALSRLSDKTKQLEQDQFYFGAMRFDQQAPVALEWQSFGTQLFILPVLMLLKKQDRCSLHINFCATGHISFNAWVDHALSLLQTIARATPVTRTAPKIGESFLSQNKNEYAATIERALFHMATTKEHQKVVMGRRRRIETKNVHDPAQLFFGLKYVPQKTFLFFIDNGHGASFFGASPELLYRRENNNFETESLAGTTMRAHDRVHDNQLRDDLMKSVKDNHEHTLVSKHIEEQLYALGISKLLISPMEVMSLTYAQHLLKRYQGIVDERIDDHRLLTSLHPTPAVCGLPKKWAQEFIREHEGFDRGLYAGPIGIIGKNMAEFSVAIRSALFYENKLFIYVAGGIVLGSDLNREWQELNTKEKNILQLIS